MAQLLLRGFFSCRRPVASRWSAGAVTQPCALRSPCPRLSRFAVACLASQLPPAGGLCLPLAGMSALASAPARAHTLPAACDGCSLALRGTLCSCGTSLAGWKTACGYSQSARFVQDCFDELFAAAWVSSAPGSRALCTRPGVGSAPAASAAPLADASFQMVTRQPGRLGA